MECHRTCHGGHSQVFECVRGTHLPREPTQRDMYLSLLTMGTLLADLHPAPLGTQWTTSANCAAQPHYRAPLPVVAPKTEPRRWLHDVPALATLAGTIVLGG